MKASELRSKGDAELRTELLALVRKGFNLRMQQGTGQLSRPTEMRALRRDVARIKTVMNERHGEQERT